MNGYDRQALHAIKCYHAKHGNFPPFVEATPEHMEKMDCTHFECPELPTDFTPRDPASGLRTPIVTNVPVVAVGTGDIVFRGMFLQSADINLEQAKCKTQEKFQRLGAKFARAGCLILDPKSNWGQQSYPPFLFYSRIEVFVFGEQGTFDRVMAEGYNQLPGD